MTTSEAPYTFSSEAASILYRLRREITDTPTRFKLMRAAQYIRQTEWNDYAEAGRARTRKAAAIKATATRARNADPFGMKATRELMAAQGIG